MGGGASTATLPKELEGKDVYTMDEIKAAFGDAFDEAKAEEILKGVESRDAISRQALEAALGLGGGGGPAATEEGAADAIPAATGDSAAGAAAGAPAAPAAADGMTVLQWNVAGINSNAFEFLQEDGIDEKGPFKDVLRFAGKLDTYLGTIAGKIEGEDEKVSLQCGRVKGAGLHVWLLLTQLPPPPPHSATIRQRRGQRSCVQ